MNNDTKEKNKITAEDINNLLSESTKLKELPYFNIFGLKIDVESSIVFIISIILWIALWLFFGIFQIVDYSEYFFIFYIIISLTNVLNSANDISDAETERTHLSSQQSFIQGGIAVFILAFVFLYNIEMGEEDKTKVYQILIISLIISSLAIIILNLKNEPSNIRFIRKTQQLFYNQGLVLFILALFMIFRFKTFKKI